MVPVPEGIHEWAVVVAVVGWLITLLGLATSNRQTNHREARKAYRAALDNLENDVERLLSAYLTYVMEVPAKTNERARLLIYSELNRLRRHVESLEPDVDGLMASYATIFESITGGDFESKTRKLSDADASYRGATAAAEGLLSCAEQWFRKDYIRKGFWRMVFG